MIHEAELRRLAATNGVDTMVQDLDYVPPQQPVTFEMAWQRVLDTAATLTQSTQEPS